MIINQEERLENVEQRVTAAYQREIKQNLVVHRITEGQNETRQNIMEALKNFFANIMSLEQEVKVVDAYRMGQGRIRPIMVKLHSPSDKVKIFSKAVNLAGKVNSKGKPYFVHEDLADEQAELAHFLKNVITFVRSNDL